jgi:hypothetical protein
MSETTVSASRKIVSVSLTMVAIVLTIGFIMASRASPFPSWLFLELQPARIIINSGNSSTNESSSTIKTANVL